jgi:hypothetical protein
MAIGNQANPQAADANRQEPPSGDPPTDPSKRRWWQRRWGAVIIGVVGLIVGLGLGASNGTKAQTVTIQAAAQTVTHNISSVHAQTVHRIRTKTVTNTVTARRRPSQKPSLATAYGDLRIPRLVARRVAAAGTERRRWDVQLLKLRHPAAGTGLDGPSRQRGRA